MQKTEDILKIIEECFLSIHIDTHWELQKMNSSSESIKDMKAKISQELLYRCKPAIEKYLEEMISNWLKNGK